MEEIVLVWLGMEVSENSPACVYVHVFVKVYMCVPADAGPWAGIVSNFLRRLSAFDDFSLTLSCCKIDWQSSKKCFHRPNVIIR